ncbi:hypothetical protein [Gracilibacillus dipsosauri]|uniref:hypothetical protein n=1 Tax=Gracilibacillus dipsosauri TaxID=178340 RepID=UPI00240A5453
MTVIARIRTILEGAVLKMVVIARVRTILEGTATKNARYSQDKINLQELYLVLLLLPTIALRTCYR